MDHSKQLGEEKISRLLLRFSVPAVIGMLTNALYNVIDRIFIGNSVGALGLAGITVGFPLMLIMMAFMMLVGLGGNALVSIKLGEGKKDEAERILGNSLMLLIVISLAISALGLIFLTPLLRLFGASDNVLPFAKSFMSIILLGTFFQAVGFGMNNFIRGEGNPKTAMMTMLIGAILNTLLCPVFIFGLGMGVKGSALATVIAQGVSAFWVMRYFLSGKSSLKLKRVNLKLDQPLVTKIFALGSAPFLLQLAASLVNAVLNKSLVHYGGDIAISGMGIVSSILTLIMMPIFGLNQGVQPIIGYNYGAKQYTRVKEALKAAVIAATVVTTAGFLLVQIFPGFIIRLFTKNEIELINFSTYALRGFLLFLPIIGFQIISSGYFQAVGKPKQSAFLSLSRQLVLLIPAVLLLPLFFGLHGVVIAGPVSDLGSSVLAAILILKEIKHLDQLQAPIVELQPQ